MGRFQEAVAAADEAIKLCPDWPKPYFRKGSALEAMGDTEGALAAFGTCSVLLDEQVMGLIMRTKTRGNSGFGHSGRVLS